MAIARFAPQAVVMLSLLILSLGILSPAPMAELASTDAAQAAEISGTQSTPDSQMVASFEQIVFTPAPSDEQGIRYVCRRGTSYMAYFGVSRVYYLVDGESITLEFPGSNPVVPEGEKPTGSVTNYILGSDESQWKTGLQDFAELRYREIYPGIDLVYRIDGGSLKYEFVVAPGGGPGLIRMRYPDANLIDAKTDCLSVTKAGFSVIDTGLWAFQNVEEPVEVACAFRPLERNTIGFNLGHYEMDQSLVIDPVLVFGTYLGGSSSDRGDGVAAEDGSVYVTGSTFSVNFPTHNANDSTHNGLNDCFVAKFDNNGHSLVYSTFIGGSGDDFGRGIAVLNGYAYITGDTSSSDFPIVNGYDQSQNGDTDCFVARLSADGQSINYSTFIGGSLGDYGWDIAVEEDYAYITGLTESSDFPTVSAYDSTHNGGYDCIVVKLATDGQSLVYSTFLGGATYDDLGRSIDVESGHAYVTGSTLCPDFPTALAYDASYNGGRDCFITKIGTSGSTLDYSTFLGETGDDIGYGIAVENGNAYVLATTDSTAFPTLNAYDSTHNGAHDLSVTKFTTSGSALIYSTFIGGSDNERGNDIAVENGCAYVTGYTASTDFPTLIAYDSTHNGGDDCCLTKLDTSGESLVYSTFFGGSALDSGEGIDVENGYAYVVGYTFSPNLPTDDAYDPTYNGDFDCFLSAFAEDADSDGLSDPEEAELGTNPYCVDTDNDNFLDSYEVAYGSDPTNPGSYPGMPQIWFDYIYNDLDGNATLIQQVILWLDGNYTAIEDIDAELLVLTALVTGNTELLNTLSATHIEDIDSIREILDSLGFSVGDSDYDGLDDLDELSYGTDVLCIDTDCDNLNDAFEVKLGTDPLDDDSDGDSYLDGIEVIAGTDPLNPLDYPGATTEPDNMVLMGLVLLGVSGVVTAITLVFYLKRRRSV
ncbi:MAG: hypothetical protein EAX95_14890 [Candidatus Thorarchaeota archaeon]|nr:hypothetical protein [Candidatus Thorarchaeota archaeon]